MLGLGLADQDPDDVFIGTSKRITIKNGRATATISKPGLPSGKYEVEVSFYPRWGPQDSIAKAAGANSEIHALQTVAIEGTGEPPEGRAATGERSAVDHGERLRWNSLGIGLIGSAVSANIDSSPSRVLSPRIIKAYYFKSLDMTIFVNELKGRGISLENGSRNAVRQPSNKALQPTANPLRGLSAAELGR